MKKVISILLTAVISLNLTLWVFAENIQTSGEQEYNEKVSILMHRGEEETNLANAETARKYKPQIDHNTSMLEKTLSYNTNNLLTERKILSKKIIKEICENEKKILEQNGFVELIDEEEIATRSVATDLSWTSEVTYFHSDLNLYRYTVDWSIASLDRFYDTDDLAGIYITNPNDFTIHGTFGKTFSSWGTETCYVDDFGNSTPATSSLSGTMYKYSENATGVIFGVNDAYRDNFGYAAQSGRMTMYIAKKPNVTSVRNIKFIASYEHNYKEFAWNASASITSAGFSSITGAISVTYSQVNKTWQRASGGKNVNW